RSHQTVGLDEGNDEGNGSRGNRCSDRFVGANFPCRHSGSLCSIDPGRDARVHAVASDGCLQTDGRGRGYGSHPQSAAADLLDPSVLSVHVVRRSTAAALQHREAAIREPRNATISATSVSGSGHLAVSAQICVEWSGSEQRPLIVGLTAWFGNLTATTDGRANAAMFPRRAA